MARLRSSWPTLGLVGGWPWPTRRYEQTSKLSHSVGVAVQVLGNMIKTRVASSRAGRARPVHTEIGVGESERGGLERESLSEPEQS